MWSEAQIRFQAEEHCYCDTDGEFPRTCVWDTPGEGAYADKITDCKYAAEGIKRDDCKWWRYGEQQKAACNCGWSTVADKRIADLEDICDGLGRRVQSLENPHYGCGLK